MYCGSIKKKNDVNEKFEENLINNCFLVVFDILLFFIQLNDQDIDYFIFMVWYDFCFILNSVVVFLYIGVLLDQ